MRRTKSACWFHTHAVRTIHEWIAGCAHDAVSPRCSVVVHHGGAGTTQTTLRVGRAAVDYAPRFDATGAELSRYGRVVGAYSRPAMKSLVSKVSGDLLLTLHGASAPSTTEWDAHLVLLGELARANGGSLAAVRSLVFSDGGMPGSAQRQSSTRIIDTARGREMPIAMVSSSSVVRGVVTAAHWFGLNMRAFTPAELHDALRYLAVAPERHADLRRDLADLARDFRCEALSDARW